MSNNKFEVTGTITEIFEAQQVTENFRKLDFIIEIEDGQYPQLIKFQLTQGNIEKINNFTEAEKVKVHFNLKGRAYESGLEKKYFTNLEAWKIEEIRE